MSIDDLHAESSHKTEFKFEDMELSPHVRHWIVLFLAVSSVLFVLVILQVMAMESEEEKIRQKNK